MPENVRQNIYSTLSLLYFYNLFSYSAIQPQVCDKLSVQCSIRIWNIWLVVYFVHFFQFG